MCGVCALVVSTAVYDVAFPPAVYLVAPLTCTTWSTGGRQLRSLSHPADAFGEGRHPWDCERQRSSAVSGRILLWWLDPKHFARIDPGDGFERFLSGNGGVHTRTWLLDLVFGQDV